MSLPQILTEWVDYLLTLPEVGELRAVTIFSHAGKHERTYRTTIAGQRVVVTVTVTPESEVTL